MMLESILQAVDGYQRTQLDQRGHRPAAVLVPLYAKAGEVFLVLQVRTYNVDQHKGQISFPGGMRDPQDRDAVDTALRESCEEIGLRPQDVQVVGLLDDSLTITGFRITPVVGRIPADYAFRTNPDEVHKLLQVPWSLFVSESNLLHGRLRHDDVTFEVDYYPYEGYQIWGATARIIRHLVDLTKNV